MHGHLQRGVLLSNGEHKRHGERVHGNGHVLCCSQRRARARGRRVFCIGRQDYAGRVPAGFMVQQWRGAAVPSWIVWQCHRALDRRLLWALYRGILLRAGVRVCHRGAVLGDRNVVRPGLRDADCRTTRVCSCCERKRARRVWRRKVLQPRHRQPLPRGHVRGGRAPVYCGVLGPLRTRILLPCGLRECRAGGLPLLGWRLVPLCVGGAYECPRRMVRLCAARYALPVPYRVVLRERCYGRLQRGRVWGQCRIVGACLLRRVCTGLLLPHRRAIRDAV